MSFKKVTACLAAAAVMLVMLSAALAQEGVVPDFTNGVVKVTGKGFGMSKYKSEPGRYRLTAEKAARMDAQAKLVEFIEVQVNTNARATEYVVDEYVVSTSAKGVVRNAREVESPKHYPDGMCEIVMEMPLFGGAGSVAEVAYLPFKDEPKVAFPQPSTTVSQSTTGYTGLVIDCRGKNLKPAMAPVIKNDNGNPIYGHQNLNYDKMTSNGLVSYANDINDQISRSRAGNNPLIVEADSLSDSNANPVISVTKADKILAANQHDKFLENCAVVFVK